MPQRVTVRRNLLANPGGSPGYDPAHVAAQSVKLSAIASQGNFVNLLNGAVGSLNGSALPLIDPICGPEVNCNSSPNGSNFSGYTTTPPAFTAAAIITTPSSIPTFLATFSNTGAAAGYQLFANRGSGGGVSINCYGGNFSNSAINLQGNTPYFIAASCPVGSSVTVNFVVVNLRTGQTQSAVMTGQTLGQTNTYNGTFVVGSFQGGGALNIAAVMHSTKFLSVQQLLQWAQDPWSFWYPQKQSALLFSGLPSAKQSPTSGSRASPIIYRRNPFTFPGGQARFDPSHFAAKGISRLLGYSYAPVSGQANVVNLLTGRPGTFQGGGTFSSATIPILGPVFKSNNQFSPAFLGDLSNFQLFGWTCACMVSILDAGANVSLAYPGNMSFNQQFQLQWSDVTGNGLYRAPIGVTCPLNVPCFAAMSANGAVVNALVLNLTNGELNYSSQPWIKFAGMSTSTAFGSGVGGGGGSGAWLGPGMFSPTYLPLDALIAWARAPWDFWYPPTLQNILFGGLSKAFTPPTVPPPGGWATCEY